MSTRRAGRFEAFVHARAPSGCRTAVRLADDFRHARTVKPRRRLIRLRYERKSIIITSNRGASEWPGVFGDPLLASAAVDRLRHHAHILEIDGPSYRDPRAHPHATS